MLIDFKVEHHLKPLSGIAEVLQVCVWQNICLGENDSITLAPGEKFAEAAQHVILFDRPAKIGALLCDDERHSIHAKTRDAELQPKPHDLQDLRLNLRM